MLEKSVSFWIGIGLCLWFFWKEKPANQNRVSFHGLHTGVRWVIRIQTLLITQHHTLFFLFFLVIKMITHILTSRHGLLLMNRKFNNHCCVNNFSTKKMNTSKDRIRVVSKFESFPTCSVPVFMGMKNWKKNGMGWPLKKWYRFVYKHHSFHIQNFLLG